MPYFLWKGINLEGSIKRGIRFARNQSLLEKVLLNEEIALLSALEQRILGSPRISGKILARLCTTISNLLDAGIRLDEALMIASKTTPHLVGRGIMYDCAHALREGCSFSQALERYVPIVDALMVPLIEAGEESGALKSVFKILSDHYTCQDRLRKEMRLALLMPAITFFFFVIITLSIFLIVIPRFELLFLMLNKPMPSLTRHLFSVSTLMKHNYLWITGILCTAIALGVRAWNYKPWRRARSQIGLRMPLLATIIRRYDFTFFLHTLAFLLEGGVHLVKALSLAHNTVSNEALKDVLATACSDVESGVSLSVAFSRHPLLRSPEIESLFLLGETTGNLAPIVRRTAEIYYQDTQRMLTFITTLIPPLLLLLLGCIIGLLVFAVYTPLLTLSWNIG